MSERIKATVEVEGTGLPVTTKAALMSTIKLSKYVNSFFKGIFKDYIGCKIYPVFNDAYSQRHPVRCDLYFTLGADNCSGATLSAFQPISDPVKATTSNGTANYTAMICAHNARLKSLNTAQITDDAVDIIHSLLWREIATQTKETPEAYSQKSVVREQTTPMPYNMGSEVVTPVISYIDINVLMEIIVNGTSKDDSKKLDEFLVTPVRSIAMMNPQAQMYAQSAPGENYLYQVCILNKEELADVMNEIGYISRTGNADCFTDTF